MSELSRFLDDLNEQYLKLHQAKETLFWETRMGLSDRHEELAERDVELREFLGDAKMLRRLRAWREKGASTPAEGVVLDGWIEMFSRNQVEDPEAKETLKEIVRLEKDLHRARGVLKLGYADPETGEFVAASSVALMNMVRSHADAARRRAAFAGLRSIEPFALATGYPEIVKLRNRFARKLGYADFYDYKVQWAEGFDKKTLFGFLDELEARTREHARKEIERLAKSAGTDALEPWNFAFHTWGSVQEERDPYFRFEDALERWARSFSALGIRYRNARVTLDLIDRKGKYENGFMHGPVPAFRRRGEWLPAEINFTANALPDQVGSGFRAAETLFHEGGHAAHFANIRMDAPCFSQEFAPTSVAFAETQSMFLDSLLADADWQTRYARDADGKKMPFELIEKSIRLQHPFFAQDIRNMLTICYAEKELYELPEAELTAERILGLCRDVEKRVLQLPSGCPRPTLAVPHLLSWESSAYYHGYVLAQMAVYQTREYFVAQYGHLLDNPAVGKDLAETYWAPGNSRKFLTLIEDLTGKPLSADALVNEASRSTETAIADARAQVAKLPQIPVPRGEVELDVRLRIIHGAQEVVEEGRRPLEAATAFRRWILQNWPREKAAATG